MFIGHRSRAQGLGVVGSRFLQETGKPRTRGPCRRWKLRHACSMQNIAVRGVRTSKHLVTETGVPDCLDAHSCTGVISSLTAGALGRQLLAVSACKQAGPMPAQQERNRSRDVSGGLPIHRLSVHSLSIQGWVVSGWRRALGVEMASGLGTRGNEQSSLESSRPERGTGWDPLASRPTGPGQPSPVNAALRR